MKMFKVNNAIGCPHCGAMLCKADTGIRMVTGQIGGINQEMSKYVCLVCKEGEEGVTVS
tara:strand:+ start:235 stop:411 length:177 start_codon:yes stop_codon:yes gene_type:complete